MKVLELQKYGRMPVAPRSAAPASETLYQRPAPRIAKPLAPRSFWQAWLEERN